MKSYRYRSIVCCLRCISRVRSPGRHLRVKINIVKVFLTVVVRCGKYRKTVGGIGWLDAEAMVKRERRGYRRMVCIGWGNMGKLDG